MMNLKETDVIEVRVLYQEIVCLVQRRQWKQQRIGCSADAGIALIGMVHPGLIEGDV